MKNQALSNVAKLDGNYSLYGDSLVISIKIQNAHTF